jgi:putative Mg2+ transporter-C (MgtC) family protein
VTSLLSLAVAALGGALLGLERESEGKAAGLRTHLLVALGAALATQISAQVTGFGTPATADPGRIAAQVVSGIGFIGAGVVIQSRGSVRGLTTAATLWVAAMVGMAAGMEAYLQAAFVTIIALLALRGLTALDAWFRRRPHWHVVEITWARDPGSVEAMLDRVRAEGLPVRSLEGVFARDGAFGCQVRIRGRREEVARTVVELGRDPAIREVRSVASV